MARDQEPVSDEAIEALQEEMAEQQTEIREALAEDLGGEPEDYSAERYFQNLDSDHADEAVPDGGD